MLGLTTQKRIYEKARYDIIYKDYNSRLKYDNVT